MCCSKFDFFGYERCYARLATRMTNVSDWVDSIVRGEELGSYIGRGDCGTSTIVMVTGWNPFISNSASGLHFFDCKML
jgi:hypothetical protein